MYPQYPTPHPKHDKIVCINLSMLQINNFIQISQDYSVNTKSVKMSARVAPEVYLGDVYIHSIHLCKKANKAESTLALKPRVDITRNMCINCP